MDTRESENLVARSQWEQYLHVVLSKSEISGKHKPRKQLSLRSVSCPLPGQSLKTVAPEPVKKDKSKASKITKKPSTRSQIKAVGDGCHRGCMILLATHAFYILPNWGCETLASDDIIPSLLVLYSQLWEYVDTNPSTTEKLAPTKVADGKRGWGAGTPRLMDGPSLCLTHGIVKVACDICLNY